MRQGFQRFRRGLGEELGIEPSPELCRLEEQILLHDPRIIPSSVARRAEPAPTLVNPFKGLHAFREADAEDFFGRDRLVAEVLARVGSGAKLVALVGPSGSGKSSVVRAGVVPALRKGAVEGSEQWLFASMVPGAPSLLRMTTQPSILLLAAFEMTTQPNSNLSLTSLRSFSTVTFFAL